MADKPFPTSEAELNLFLQNLVVKLPTYQAALGLTNGDLQRLSDDADNFSYIIAFTTQLNDSKDAYFDFKDELFDGAPSTTALAIPTFPVVAMPGGTEPGIKKRTRNLVQRIKFAPGYTEQIGEDLGFIDSSGGGGTGPGGLTAELTVGAISGNRVQISFSKQGMDAMRVEFMRKNDVAWSLAGIYTASPGIHDAPSASLGDPESRQYRGVLLQRNEQVGSFSPIYTVVTTP